MNTEPSIDCSDLYDNAAERLKELDKDIDKTIQDLAKDVEARGVPKNKVARQVVKELTAREVLSPSRIYEGLGVEQKRKYKKREIEETFPQAEIIPTEESSSDLKAIQVAATRIGQSETLKDMNGIPDIRTVSEEQKQIAELTQENKRLKEKERLTEKEKSELIKKMAYLKKENTRLNSEKEECERQLAEKTEQISGLRKDNESLKKEHQLELLQKGQTKVSDTHGTISAKNIQKISIEEGKNFVLALKRRNTVIQEKIESKRKVSLEFYNTAKHETKLIPVIISIDFIKGRVWLSLWEEKLQTPSQSVPASSDAASVGF